MQAEQQRRVAEVAKVLYGTLGSDFFRSLVEHLTTTLAVDYAYVAELTNRHPNSSRQSRSLTGTRRQRTSSRIYQEPPLHGY